METLKFYDVKAKKKFTSSDYKIVEKRVRGRKVRFAVAKSPTGTQSWRILPSLKKK